MESNTRTSTGRFNKLRNLILGLQHVLAMYSGGILVPLLIGAALHFNAQQMAYLI